MAKIKARLETAQHILYRILKVDYGAESAAMQIYEDKIRFDVRCNQDLIKIPKQEFEKKVNAIIKKDFLVSKTIFKRNEVPENVDISRIPESIKEIRIVAIGDFDIQPCANPHVDSTSEIGEYRILEIKKKGKDTYRFLGTVIDKKEA